MQLKGAGEPARQRKKTRHSDKIRNRSLDLLISETDIIVLSYFYEKQC